MKDFKTVHYVSLLVVFVVALLIGYSLAYKNSPLSSLKNSVNKNNSQEEALFSAESALVQGKITAISGNNLSVTNSKGINGNIEASSKILIIKPGKNGVASPSSDLKSVDLNKDVTINLQKENGTYKVFSINYQVPLALPSLPPIKLPSPPPASQLKQ